jgi:tetratricopeptide (TPR) repeat protein
VHHVAISGEAGIGKSRISQAVQDRVAGEQHTRLRHFCSPHHQDSALHPIIARLERAAGFRRDDTNEQRFAKLETLLAQVPTDVGEAVPLIADLLSTPTGERCPPLELTAQMRREKLLQLLLAQVEGLAMQNPILMVFEDTHWADPTTQELLDLLVDRVPGFRVLVIVTFRPEFTPPWAGRPQVTLLTLNRLSPRQRADMMARVAGGKTLPKEIADQINHRTDGIPLFVEELTKAVLESGILVEVGDTYQFARPPTPLAIPTSLHGSLLARLDRLAPVRDIAQVAAALGPQFSHELVSAVASVPREELDHALDQLVRAELLFRRGRPPDAEYKFKHTLVQDAAYSTLLRSRRRQIHAKIASILEQKFPEIAAAQPALLAHHYAEAGLAEEAIQKWIEAGDHSERRGMTREAVAHYRSARALFSPTLTSAVRALEPRLLMKLGGALQQIEWINSAAALQAYQDARNLAATLGQEEDWANAGIGVAPLLFGSCQYRKAAQILNEVSEKTLDRLSPQTRVHYLTISSIVNFAIGEYQMAWTDALQAIALDDEVACTHNNPIGGADPAVVARGYAINVGGGLGHFGHCLSLGERALVLARSRNHAFSVAWAIVAAVRAYRHAGQFDEAIRIGNEGITICQKHELWARMGTILMVTGQAHFGTGETERGLAEIRRGFEIWREASGRFHISWYSSEFADCLLRAAKYDQTDMLLREAERTVTETDERSHFAELLRIRGVLLVLRGGHSWRCAEPVTGH